MHDYYFAVYAFTISTIQVDPLTNLIGLLHCLLIWKINHFVTFYTSNIFNTYSEHSLSLCHELPEI